MKAQASFSGPEVPFATVVTDLTRCHRTWFHKQVDKCFVATQLVAAQAMKVGLTAKQLSCYGQGPSIHKTRFRLTLRLDLRETRAFHWS